MSLRKKSDRNVYLPSVKKLELAALRPIATCRRETEDICKYQAQAHEFVPGSNLPVVLRVAVRRLQMALDLHSSLLFSLLNRINFSLSFKDYDF